MPSIFISYRRDDSENATGRIHGIFVDRCGQDQVFRDTTDIGPGEPFPDRLRRAVGECRVVLAVIGPGWLSTRLNDPEDWVRRELESALARKVDIVPVLINGAKLPPKAQLPDPLK